MRQTELAMDGRAASSKETSFLLLGSAILSLVRSSTKEKPYPFSDRLTLILIVSSKYQSTTNCNFHGPYGMLIILLKDLPRPDTEVTANCVFQVLEPI